jgi:thiamine pyrophosphate-dependent acetolactate synthase large subunit-like protein
MPDQQTDPSARDFSLDRNTAVPALLGRHQDFLIVTGLGGPAKDVGAVAADSPQVFTMAGAMGAAVSICLGLALARPERQVLVVTGDGELLMNVGALATVAVAAPRNLSILCVDNGRYGETGYQMTHTALGTSLEQMARGAGFRSTLTLTGEEQLAAGAGLLRSGAGPSLVVVRVAPTEPPPFRRDFDGAAGRLRFREHVLGIP